MSREMPAFLKDFLNMRKSLHVTQNASLVSSTPSLKAPIRPKKVGTKSTSEGQQDELFGISVAKIIEDKPPKKEVMAFFQQECDRLTAEKMK